MYMRSQYKTMLFLALETSVVLFLSGCYLKAQFTDTTLLSSDQKNPPPTEIQTPTEPTPTLPTPPVTSGLTVSFSAPSTTKINSTATYTVTISEPQPTDLNVSYETQDSSAQSPQNYIANRGTVTILAGNTTANFYINTTDKADTLGTFKDFIARLTFSSAGTITSGDKITSVGMYQLSNVTSLNALQFKSAYCTIDTSNQVWCWGTGEGNSPKKSTTVNFPVAKIIGGNSHKCALTTTSGVKCWGLNWAGQLGDNSTTDSTDNAVDPLGLSSGVADIQSGINHSCALTSSGGIKCWGYNGRGQLGNNSTTNSTIPIDVIGLTSGVSKIWVSSNFSCAQLVSTGGLKCWGENSSGELGDTTTTQRLTPVDVNGLTTGVADVSLGAFYSCAITSANALKCWGNNLYGQLGDSTKTSRSTPTNVVSLASGVVKVFAGKFNTCALLDTSEIRCWGINRYGEVGDGTFQQRLTPVTASLFTGVILDIKSIDNTTCILKNDNKVYCIGDNSYGYLGDGSMNNTIKYPKKVFNSGSNVISASKGENHTCLITNTNAAQCWGSNYQGQIGDGTVLHRSSPTAVTGLSSGVTAIASGRYHNCVLMNTGAVKCWGQNSDGQLGDNTIIQKTTPIDVSGLSSGVAAITAGRYHSCALLNTGGVKCWGANDFGQLGDSTTTPRRTPVDVTGLTTGVQMISAGFNHTCALITGGTIKCWGYNGEGELGDSTTTHRNTPVNVTGISSGTTKVSGGQFGTCAVVSGAVKCWGANWSGNLGDDTYNDSSIPVDVIGASSGIVDVMASGYDYNDYVCALNSSGGLKCWGDNSYNQVGNSTFEYSYGKAVDVIGLSSGVSSMIKGIGVQNCVITTAGDLKCWGYNDSFNKAGGNISTAPEQVLVAPEDL